MSTQEQAQALPLQVDLTSQKTKIIVRLILRSVTFIAGITFLLVTSSRDAEGYLVIDAGSQSALIGFGIMVIPYILLILRILFKGAKAILNDFSFSYTVDSQGRSSDYTGNFLGMLLSKLFFLIFRALLAIVVVSLLILLTPIQIIYYIVMLVKLK